jgi:AcrR family transcriptional regulator
VRRTLGDSVISGRADARRNRQRVIDAALQIFGSKGAAASTEEVAAHAGVGIATVFRHFPTKQTLLEAVVLSRLERLVVRGHEIEADADAGQFFVLFAVFVEEAHNKRVFGDVLTGASDEFRAANVVIVDELWAIFGRLIARGQAAGLIRAEFDVADIRALLAAAHQALQVVGDDPERRRRLLAVLSDGVRTRPAK